MYCMYLSLCFPSLSLFALTTVLQMPLLLSRYETREEHRESLDCDIYDAFMCNSLSREYSYSIFNFL